jgi:hypothetical protein
VYAREIAAADRICRSHRKACGRCSSPAVCRRSGTRSAWGESLLLTGEHLFPWHFEDERGLRPYREVAAELARRDWPRWYDADRLARVDVPCAAVIYADDPYVDRRFSEETADLLPGMHRWLTDEYLHNGLGTDGGRVLDRLIGLVRD